MEKGEIVIYRDADDADFRIDVRIEDETVWLTQSQIVSLFSSSKANISEHIKHIFYTKELKKQSTVRKFRTVQMEGIRKVSRNITHYNLDVIISVGYRVNSIRGTQFRIWANSVLKDYLLKGYAINQRVDKIERKLFEHEQKFELLIKSNLPPREGIFFDGQVFDAYSFVADIIKSAKASIILIDNFIDESVLLLLAKRNQKVKATIFTKNLTRQLKLDLERHNKQYPRIEIKPFQKSHDRFLIIDNKKVFHIGASLKDLGKRWFAFSQMDSLAKEILDRLTDKAQRASP